MSEKRKPSTFPLPASAWLIPVLLIVGWGPLFIADLVSTDVGSGFGGASGKSGAGFGMAWGLSATLFCMLGGTSILHLLAIVRVA
jgi:hypothetical protein